MGQATCFCYLRNFGLEGVYSSTKKGNIHSVFVYDLKLKNIRLSNAKSTLISVKDENGKPVKFTQNGSNIDLDFDSITPQFVSVLTLVFK
jgi:hypothetical protein